MLKYFLIISGESTIFLLYMQYYLLTEYFL